MIHVTRVSNKERERDLIYGGFHTHTPHTPHPPHTHTHTHTLTHTQQLQQQQNTFNSRYDSSAINICGYKYVSQHFIILWNCIKFLIFKVIF